MHAGIPPQPNAAQSDDYFAGQTREHGSQANLQSMAGTEATPTHAEDTSNGGHATAPTNDTVSEVDVAIVPQFG